MLHARSDLGVCMLADSAVSTGRRSGSGMMAPKSDTQKKRRAILGYRIPSANFPRSINFENCISNRRGKASTMELA